MGPGCYVSATAALQGVIRTDFGSEADHALQIADRESGCNPTADNAISTASGPFQIVAGTWSYWAARCGHAGASVWDTVVHVAVAACMVADGGWGPWSPLPW